MIKVQAISDLELPELAPYRTMQWQYEHRQQGIFVAEGDKVIERLLQSDLTIISLLLPIKWLQIYQPLLDKRTEDITVFTADKSLLENLTGFSLYQGIMAVAKVPHIFTLEELLEHSKSPRLFVAVDSISSAQNIGALVRTCAAFGVQGVIIGENSCSPYLRRAVRGSMGTIFKLPIVESKSLIQTLEQLQKAKVSCIAAHPHTDQVFLPDADLQNDCCIFLGSEGDGISPEILKACNQVVAIQMHDEVDSLNVGTAGGVFLYEVQRQRRNCVAVKVK